MSTQEQLKKIASQTEQDLDELKKEYKDILSELEGKDNAESLALRKTANLAKRRARRVQRLDEFTGFIIASTQPTNIGRSPNVATDELYVKNALGITEAEEPFMLTLWNKAATHMSLPLRKLVSFKGSNQGATFALNMSIPESAMSTLEPEDDIERDMLEFKEALEDTFFTPLSKLEGYFEEKKEQRPPDTKGPIPVMVEGSVQDMSSTADNQGRHRVYIDDMSAFDDDYTTVIQVPETLVDKIELDTELLVIGDLWKPSRSYDRELGEVVDEPDRVRVNAWDIQVFPFGDLLEW